MERVHEVRQRFHVARDRWSQGAWPVHHAGASCVTEIGWCYATYPCGSGSASRSSIKSKSWTVSVANLTHTMGATAGEVRGYATIGNTCRSAGTNNPRSRPIDVCLSCFYITKAMLAKHVCTVHCGKCRAVHRGRFLVAEGQTADGRNRMLATDVEDQHT